MATAANWRTKLQQIEALDAGPGSRASAKTAITAKRGAFGSFDTFGNGPEDETCDEVGRAAGEPQDGRRIAAVPNSPDTASPASGDSAASPRAVIASRDDFEERAALIEYGAGVPREWAEGFARLDMASPPRGLDQRRWRTLIDDGGRFLDQWGAEAARLGWSALDVFGVHPVAPNARYDAMGLVLLINGGEVISIKSDRATIRARGSGSLLTYLRRPSAGGVALWELSP